MKTNNTRSGSTQLPRNIASNQVAQAMGIPPEELQATFNWQGLSLNTNDNQPINDEWKPFFSFLIDTVRVRVAVQHLPLAELTAGNPNVKRHGFKYIVTCPATGASAQVVSKKDGTVLFIEFSIPKFLTGQNIAGHLDVAGGCLAGIKKALKLLGIRPTSSERKAIISGDFCLTRVDVTAHVDCRTRENADALMLALRGLLISHGQDVSMYRTDTLYIGQHSCRRTLKIYHKGRELEQKGRSIPPYVYGHRFLTRKAQSLIRLELTLRGKELARLGLTSPLAWNATIAQNLMTPWVQVLQRAEGTIPHVDSIGKLSAVMQAKLNAWLLGDVSAFSRDVTHDTYREGRNRVLKATGINVDTPLSPEEQARCLTTMRSLFQRGFGYRTHEHKWNSLVAAVVQASQQPNAVTTSQP